MDPYPCRLVTDLFVISSDRFEREKKKKKNRRETKVEEDTYSRRINCNATIKRVRSTRTGIIPREITRDRMDDDGLFANLRLLSF